MAYGVVLVLTSSSTYQRRASIRGTDPFTVIGGSVGVLAKVT
jgi:hypothetical protein